MGKVVTICSTNRSNIGGAGCLKANPFKDIGGLKVTSEDFEYATAAAWALEVNHTNAIKNGKMIFLNPVDTEEDQSEETQFYNSPGGINVKRRNGKYQMKYMFNVPLNVHKALQTWDGQDVRVFPIDVDGNEMGWSPDGTIIKGFTLSMFAAEKQVKSKQDGTPALSPITIQEQNSKEWNEKGVYINTTENWDTFSLKNLTDVVLTVVGAITALLLTVKLVYNAGLNPDGTVNEVPITGVDDADWTTLDAAGDAQAAPSGITDNEDGTYTMVYAALETGSIDLVTPINMVTTGLPIDTTGPAAIVVA